MVEKDIDTHAVTFYKTMLEKGPAIARLFTNRSESSSRDSSRKDFIDQSPHQWPYSQSCIHTLIRARQRVGRRRKDRFSLHPIV